MICCPSKLMLPEAAFTRPETARSVVDLPAPWVPESPTLRQLYQLVVQADALRLSLRQWGNRRHAQSYLPDLPAV
ncbi:MAG TPA: hypothetical protein VN285_06600, partial [Candidatus Deferrimicrobium sp.]|nr:hypothetical protein [Candidatus Deferrimicrobium sp.]